MTADLPAPQSLRVQSGDVSLSASIYPNPGKPVLLFVHGYPDNSAVWDKVIAPLRARYHIVTYDVRGAGMSDAPRPVRAYKMAHLTEDLIAVIDQACDGGPVHLIAHDWGSIQCWNAIMDTRVAERVASYTTLSGVSIDHLGLWVRKRFAKGEVLTGLNQLVKSWYIYAFHIPFLAEMTWNAGLAKRWHKMLGRQEGVRVEKNPHQLKDGKTGVKLYRANIFPHLLRPDPGPITTPVQLLVLTRDPFVSPGIFSDHADHVDRLWRREIATPHWLPLRDPELLARFIDDFVSYQTGGAETPALARARRKAERLKAGPMGGKQVLITGAGGGIGRCIALAFADEGADIVVSDINEAAAGETARLVREKGAQAQICVADVSDPASMDALAAFVDEVTGPIDIAVNNAGIGMAGGQLEMTREAWARILGINLMGVIEGSRLFGARMVADRQPGHIVNTVSASAFLPTRAFPAYAVSKAAALMQSESLRGELAEHGIGVTAACPGFVDTGIAQATEYVGTSENDQAARRNNADAMYKRRAYTPEKVAAKVLKAVKKNKPIALIGAEAWIGRGVQRFAPALGRAFARLKLPAPKDQ